MGTYSIPRFWVFFGIVDGVAALGLEKKIQGPTSTNHVHENRYLSMAVNFEFQMWARSTSITVGIRNSHACGSIQETIFLHKCYTRNIFAPIDFLKLMHMLNYAPFG